MKKFAILSPILFLLAILLVFLGSLSTSPTRKSEHPTVQGSGADASRRYLENANDLDGAAEAAEDEADAAATERLYGMSRPDGGIYGEHPPLIVEPSTPQRFIRPPEPQRFTPVNPSESIFKKWASPPRSSY